MSKKKKHVQSSKEFWEEHKAPADHPIYDGTTKVIFRPKPVKTEEAKLRKLQEFLSRAPISFDEDDFNEI
tara:strand:+ start:301 stop:510 length:210 start_codon:yes stop_codon:yes gene_type:complete